MAKKSLLCKYCKGSEQFYAEYLGNRVGVRWGVRCQLSFPMPIRSFDSSDEAQRSIDEWCTGDGRRACRPYLLRETQHNHNFGGDLLREFEAMEEATVAKKTYTCKCGRTFQKSSTAQDTGYRMDDYDVEHECYGCPFVEPVSEGWGETQQIKSYECRASSTKINYTTTTDMCIEGHYVVHIYTLDLPWLDNFIRAFLSTPGNGRDNCGELLASDSLRLERGFRHAGLCQGRNAYNFTFQSNKTGTAARKTLFEQFFNEDKTAQMGPGPGKDKERIMHMIEHAKAEAREKALREDDEIFAVEEKKDMGVHTPEANENSCPFYKGIEKTYSPRGYCIDCTVRRGFDRTPFDNKSWAVDAVEKKCLSEDTFIKCRFYEKQKGIENEIFAPEEPDGNDEDVTADIASDTSCPYFAGSRQKKGGGHIVTCKTDKVFELICGDDGAHIMQMRKCTDGVQIECRCFLFSQLQEAGLNPSSEHSIQELRNMYDGLQLKQDGVSSPATSTEQEIIPATAPRSIVDVTAEIQLYKAQTVQNYIEIGRRLIEAKAMLEHGQWGIWLGNAVEFSERVARNLMAVAEQYSNRHAHADLTSPLNSQALGNLSYTKLLTLLAVPSEERDDFITAPHVVGGQEKTVGEMSSRELQKLIKERDEALQQAKNAKSHEEIISKSCGRLEHANKEYVVQRNRLEAEVRQLKDENRRQRQNIEQMERRPIDVAVEPPSDEEMERLRNSVRMEVLQEIALPETYLAKKSVEEAVSMYMDMVGGVYAQGILLASQMDRKAALKSVEAYISTMNQYTQQLRERMNLMIYADRGVDPEDDDFDA